MTESARTQLTPSDGLRMPYPDRQWFAKQLSPTLENQDPNRPEALEIRMPQLLAEAVPAK
jgi:hypothetical protein